LDFFGGGGKRKGKRSKRKRKRKGCEDKGWGRVPGQVRVPPLWIAQNGFIDCEPDWHCRQTRIGLKNYVPMLHGIYSLAPTGEYDLTIRERWRCGLVLKYFDQLYL